MDVVGYGVVIGKTLSGKQLLRIKPPIGFSKLRVPFVGNGTLLVVMSHNDNLIEIKFLFVDELGQTALDSKIKPGNSVHPSEPTKANRNKVAEIPF
jgi:hypothetical protein